MGAETALIFGSLPCARWDFLEPLRGRAAVFCADGGTRCAAEAGFPVDFYVGDSDSGGAPPPGAERLLLPAEKDLTDLQAAYELARDRGFRRMAFTGCTGGRQDHHLANLQLLETACRQGIDAVILDERNEIRCFCGGAPRRLPLFLPDPAGRGAPRCHHPRRALPAGGRRGAPGRQPHRQQ